MIRVYVAGPMSGKEHYGYAAFMEAAEHLRADGLDPHTPFECQNKVWNRHHGCDFDPMKDLCGYGSPLVKEFFAEDIALLLSCDAIYLLDGWENSRGAKIEKQIAELFSMTVMYRFMPNTLVEAHDVGMGVSSPGGLTIGGMLRARCSCGASWTAETPEKMDAAIKAHQSYGLTKRTRPD